MNNLLVKRIETFLTYIFLIFKIFKWHDCCKIVFLKVHLTLTILIFRMDFFNNHMFRDIHRLVD
jgi:hypothetical protein